MGLHYVCGLDEPEDLLQVGNSKWVIASGMGAHGGIFLIDSDAKTAKRFFTGASKPDLKMYPDCASAPANFNAHGIALRPTKVAGIYSFIPSPMCRSKASRSLPWMGEGPSRPSAGPAASSCPPISSPMR